MAQFAAGDVVTGEAVVLDLRLARLASRSLALALDLMVQLAALVAVVFVLAWAESGVDDALSAAVGLVAVLAVVVGYPVAWETLSRGRSLGKLALGLRVVREDGGPIRFRQAFVRGLLGVVEVWASFGVVAVVTSLASAHGRRVGDFLAGTVVVHERVPVRTVPLAVMPPRLAGWAEGLDLSALPADVALQARALLGRAGELAPDVRERLATATARAMAQTVAPPPPPGVSAWELLAAVLSERRRRESARLGAGGAPPPVRSTSPPPAPQPQPSVPPPAVPPPGAGDQPFAPPS